jgi:hypothetical protein
MSELSPENGLSNPYLAELQAKSFQAALDLIGRRGQAAGDYMRALAGVREPSDLVSLQLGYWTRMLDDYSIAMAGGLEPLGEAAVPAPLAAPEALADPQPEAPADPQPAAAAPQPSEAQAA